MNKECKPIDGQEILEPGYNQDKKQRPPTGDENEGWELPCPNNPKVTKSTTQ